LRRPRRHAEIAALHSRANGVLSRRSGEFLDRVAVLRKKGVKEDDRANQRDHLFGDTGNNESAVGVTTEDYVAQPLPTHHVHDIGDMRGDVDPLPQRQMGALAETGQCRSEDRVAVAVKSVGDAAPAPAAVPGAVHQHKCVRHQFPLPRARALEFLIEHDLF
jgi:hypothetical protein